MGRRSAAFGRVDLTVQVETANDLLPHLEAARSQEGLCGAMAPYLTARPSPPNLLAVLGGRKPLTRPFLRALHCAYGLHEKGLDLRVWLRGPAPFRLTLEALFVADARLAFRQLADTVPWVTLAPPRLLGAGALSDPSRPTVQVGDAVQVVIHPPRSGHLVVLNADPAADGARFFWLDPWLGVDEARFEAAPARLPIDGPFVPIGPPAHVVSSLIAIVSDVPLCSDWQRPPPGTPRSCPEIDLPRIRLFAAQLLALPIADRSVAVCDYQVDPPAASPTAHAGKSPGA